LSKVRVSLTFQWNLISVTCMILKRKARIFNLSPQSFSKHISLAIFKMKNSKSKKWEAYMRCITWDITPGDVLQGEPTNASSFIGKEKTCSFYRYRNGNLRICTPSSSVHNAYGSYHWLQF
jgi:hypothetical protein